MRRGLFLIPAVLTIAGIVILRAGEPSPEKIAAPPANATANSARSATAPATQPLPVRTIEIQTWAGYHDGKPRRLNVADVVAVTPHVALERQPDGSQKKVTGSRIETRSGAWYATDSSEDLIAHLAREGWVAPP